MASRLESVRAYAIDAAHTTVEFVDRHMVIAKIRGRFAAVTGTIVVPEGATVPLSVEVAIDAASIATGDAQPAGHLTSLDFLSAATYPQIRFRSMRVDGDGETFRIDGKLTIHNTTRRVVLDTTFEGRGTDPWGNSRIGYEARTVISRKEFGLAWNQALDRGGVFIGDEVKIEIVVDAIAQ